MFFQISQWPLWLSNLINNGFWGYARGLNLILWLIAIGLMYVAEEFSFFAPIVKKLSYRKFGCIAVLRFSL